LLNNGSEKGPKQAEEPVQPAPGEDGPSFTEFTLNT